MVTTNVKYPLKNKHFSAIFAVSLDGFIGNDDPTNFCLPWPKLGEDMKRFVSFTKTPNSKDNPAIQAVSIVGRKTFETWGRGLPGRQTIMLTANRNYQPPAGVSLEGVKVCHSKEEIMDYLTTIPNREIVVMGGPAIWSLFWPEIEVVSKTVVNMEAQGGVELPTFDWDGFTTIAQKTETWKKDEKNPYDTTFYLYVRQGCYTREQRAFMETTDYKEDLDTFLQALSSLNLTYEDFIAYNLHSLNGMVTASAMKGTDLYGYGIEAFAAAGIAGPPTDLSDLPMTFMWDKQLKQIEVSLYDMSTMVKANDNLYQLIVDELYNDTQIQLMEHLQMPVLADEETLERPVTNKEAVTLLALTLATQGLSLEEFAEYKTPYAPAQGKG